MPYTPVPPPFADELTPGWARFVNTIPGVTNDSEKELINFNLPQGETLITIPFAATKASSNLVLVGPVFVNVVDDAVISDITFSVVNFSTSAMTIVLSSAVDTDNYYLKTIVFVVGAFPSTNSSQSGLSGSDGGIATSINFGSILNLPTTLGGYGITDGELSLGDPGVDGYVLSSTTGGTRSWISPSSFSLPSQVNQSGKFLQSNGTDTAWIDALDLHSAQTMTNKVIDGAANTLQNIPRTALEGYATSTLSLTDPNADSVPYWNDTNGQFEWTSLSGIGGPPSSIVAFMGTSTVRGISKDVYIAVRTDGKAGTGTAEDPFDGSGTATGTNQTKLDALMSSFGTNTTVHLGPGTFYTNVRDVAALGTGIQMKSGWRIVGAGMSQTTVQMIGSVAGRHFDHEAFKTPSNAVDNTLISDLTVDCNYAVLSASADVVNSEPYYVAFGIGVSGNNNTVERVRVTNQYGTFANGGESFGIALGTSSGGGAGATIRFCLVDSPHGTYAGSPFTINGHDTSHPMTNWQVHGNRAVGVNDGNTNATFNTGGVNLAFVQDGSIYNNDFVDCRGIAYSDTGNCDSIRIYNNKAVRAFQGVGFVSDEGLNPTWTKSNIWASGNAINLQDRVNGEDSAFRFAGGTGIQIVGTNTVTVSTGGVGPGLGYWTVLAQGVTNATVTDLCGPNLNAQVAGSAITLNRNRTAAGAAITGLEDNQFFRVSSTAVADGDMRIQGEIASVESYDSFPLAGLLFANKYNSSGAFAGMGGIQVGKENTTDGDTASFLALFTRPSGGNNTERFRIASNGSVTIGGSMTVNGYGTVNTSQVRNNGDVYGQLTILDTTAYNASPRAGLVASVKYTSGGASAGIGGLTWSKENATDGDFAGALDISTRANGGNATSGLHMDSSQNISLSSLTASNYVKTNSSKVLVSASTIPLSDIASLGTGIATALGTNVGTAGAPVINGGALGTPSSGTLTNATGLPISGTTGYGTGIATFLATPSSANLASAVTDETGTGALVFGTAPAFTTSATVGLGSTAAPTAFTVGDTSTSSPRGIMSWQSNTGTDGARLHLRKSRGTFASPTTIVSGDTLGRVVATGYDGTSFLEMGSINILSTGTIATSRVPTQMVFQTATDAAPSVLTTALTLGADQSATFAGTLATASHGITDASLSANVPLLNQANSYTAGAKQTVTASATTSGFKFGGVSADPSSLSEGDEWYRSDRHQKRVYDGTSASSVITEVMALQKRVKELNLLDGTWAQTAVANSGTTTKTAEMRVTVTSSSTTSGQAGWFYPGAANNTGLFLHRQFATDQRAIPWGKALAVKFAFQLTAWGATTNGYLKAMYGRPGSVALNYTPAVKLIGFRLNASKQPIILCHDGTSLTESSAQTALGTGDFEHEIIVASDGAGNVTGYIDGGAGVTITGGPTTDGTVNNACFSFEVGNGGDAATNTADLSEITFTRP